jgi:predicted DNA-binding ribbon-helix-helix protein
MFKADFIRQLKRTSVSKNATKAAERLQNAWRPLDKTARKKILDLSGLTASSLDRAGRTGNLSARVVVAVSQALRLDPAYLIGAADTARAYDDVLLTEFVRELGYSAGRKAVRTAAKSKEKPAAKAKETKARESKTTAPLEKLTEDNVITLLRGLIAAAGFNRDKKVKLERIKEILVQ